MQYRDNPNLEVEFRVKELSKSKRIPVSSPTWSNAYFYRIKPVAKTLGVFDE